MLQIFPESWVGFGDDFGIFDDDWDFQREWCERHGHAVVVVGFDFDVGIDVRTFFQCQAVVGH